MSDETQATATAATVKATIQQAYDLHLNLKFLPVREIPRHIKMACQPRQGGQRQDKQGLDLPESTRSWLVDVSKVVTGWLARDSANQRAFVADPVAALRSAGVAIDRAHIKALYRLRESVGQTHAVSPGLQFRSVKTTASENGRVPSVDTGHERWTPPATHADGDCGRDYKEGRK